MLDPVNPVSPLDPAQGTASADGAVAPAIDTATRAKVTKAAIDFESFFISNMLHQMRESTRAIAPDDSPYKDKVNQNMQDMADNILAGNVANQRAFGIADAILRQLLPAAPGQEPKKPT